MWSCLESRRQTRRHFWPASRPEQLQHGCLASSAPHNARQQTLQRSIGESERVRLTFFTSASSFRSRACAAIFCCGGALQLSSLPADLGNDFNFHTRSQYYSTGSRDGRKGGSCRREKSNSKPMQSFPVLNPRPVGSSSERLLACQNITILERPRGGGRARPIQDRSAI